MGECADMLLDGTCDYITGEYIGSPCGYPRTLQHGTSKRSMIQTKKQRPQYSEARNDIHSLGGCYGLRGSELCHAIGVFLQMKGVKPLPKMNAQYRIIRGQYRNEFIQYLKSRKQNGTAGQ